MVIGKPSAIKMQLRLEPSSEPFPLRDDGAGIYCVEAIAVLGALQIEGKYLLSADHCGSGQLMVLLRWVWGKPAAPPLLQLSGSGVRHQNVALSLTA